MSDYERDLSYRDDPMDAEYAAMDRAERESEMMGGDASQIYRENQRAELRQMMRHYDRVREERLAKGLSVEGIPGPWPKEMYP